MGSTPERKPHVVCLGAPQYAGEDYLQNFSSTFTFSVLPAQNRAETIAQLPKLLSEKGPVDAFIVRMGTPPYEPFDFFAPLLPSCKIITSASAGYNEFDVDWMSANKVLFCNSVDAVAEATADMAVYLMLATLRNTSNAEKSVRSGKWRGTGLVPARDPSGMTLGIVGMGAIGKYLAKKAAVFNLKIKYHNRTQLSASEEAKYNATYCPTLHDLLSSSEIISLNCPLNPSTTNLLSTAEFAAMKDGAFLVNTARGAIIDESALKAALESGKVKRAGLDVLCNEPDVDEWFFGRDDVVLQPHLGGLTDVAFQRAERECFENVRAFFETGKANSPVNAERL
ncbi:hypothetical protein DM02DRAFT_566149 [Periconia macrospinosa]|uniref:Glycerate-and formate-dehydrogenase n=1 Tax=Periconia macrospinosa TaxID=97972 RepID=A0A2V1DK26_9PLEO|nr:hypothetical protein DM02DRAFT_566149 [Periconia macrospinosa]